MNQVLSQQEIDSLLEAVESGEIDSNAAAEQEKNKIKDYDFRRPVRLSKEYISTLNMIFEDFAKISGNLLSTQVRRNVTLQVASLEQVTFDEFISSIPRFTLMTVYRSKPMEGMQVLEINPHVCLQLIGLLCGNSESIRSSDISKKDSFTDIEMAILEEIVDSFMKSFESAWRDILEIEIEVDSMETNPQVLQSLSPNEPVILATFTMEIFDEKTFVNLCIPYVFFENILDKLSFRNWFHSEKEINQSDNGRMRKNLQSVDVDLSVLLGETSMTLENFLQLELGDVIPLDKKSSDPLELCIEQFPYYLVKPGSKNNHMAVEILQYIGGESD